MDNLQFLQTLLQLGWPGIVLIQCFLLWRDNLNLRNELIGVLQLRETKTTESVPTIHSGAD